MKNLLLLIIIILSFIANVNFGLTQEKEIKIEINFFYSDTCFHCAKEKEFLKKLETKYPEIEIKKYEVFNKENQKLLKNFYEKYKVPENEKGRVPILFLPDKYFVGFNEQTEKEIESCLKECLLQKKESSSQKITLPFWGEINISKLSLPALTIIFGLLDGFNPCAMWVLVVLISLLLASKTRKQIALIGMTFIFAEGLLYFLFMSAWLNAFLFLEHISLIKFLIGVFGIIFGIWRIREFIIWKPGVCRVVDHSKSQEKILEKMKNVLKPAVLPATILGTIVLAFSVNLIEFFCSAGFPVIFTKILSLQNIGTIQYYLYLVFYNIFYMLDDFIVFGFAFFTLNRFHFSDKYNRYSTLIAGLFILIIGILLIFKPNLLMFS